jgi:phage/plasmid-like protein (TIGR03299 family)
MTSFAVTDNLDWEVEQRPLFFPGADGNPVRFDNRVAIVRSDNEFPLGVVSEDYETVQNKDLLALIQPMVDEGILSIENMGYLNHGAKVFAQAKINQEFRVIGEDYQTYITLLNGHVGNTSVAIGPAAVRVICGNTFSMAYSNIGERFRHSEGVNQRILETKAVIDFVENAMRKYSENVETIASSTCSSAQFRNFLEATYGKDYEKMRNIEKLNDLFYNGAGNEGRTLYDAFNSVTDFSSNQSRKTVAGRFNYANFGQGNRINQRAMEVALEMASV